MNLGPFANRRVGQTPPGVASHQRLATSNLGAMRRLEASDPPYPRTESSLTWRRRWRGRKTWRIVAARGRDTLRRRAFARLNSLATRCNYAPPIPARRNCETNLARPVTVRPLGCPFRARLLAPKRPREDGSSRADGTRPELAPASCPRRKQEQVPRPTSVSHRSTNRSIFQPTRLCEAWAICVEHFHQFLRKMGLREILCHPATLKRHDETNPARGAAHPQAPRRNEPGAAGHRSSARAPRVVLDPCPDATVGALFMHGPWHRAKLRNKPDAAARNAIPTRFLIRRQNDGLARNRCLSASVRGTRGTGPYPIQRSLVMLFRSSPSAPCLCRGAGRAPAARLTSQSAMPGRIPSGAASIRRK